MEFTNFFYPDSHNDAEVSFILEVVSLLQKEFDLSINLKIHTDRDLSHLTESFLWKNKPVLVTSDPESRDVYFDLFQHDLKFETHNYILSSKQHLEKRNVSYIPNHLLNSSLNSEDISTAKAYSVAKVIFEKKFSAQKPAKKITLFHSDELREWLGLIEASEAVISFWYRQRDEDTELELINLTSLKNTAELKKVAYTSDRIVILKITPATSDVIKSIRTLNPESSFTFHGFESSSVFFANTFLYKIQEHLKKEDLWIFSCSSDETLARIAWKNIKSVVKPLKFPSLHKNLKIKSTGHHLLFFGRISEQKNLHEGLFAVKILEDKMRKENRKFKIFGYEDFLGVPNLRIPSSGYLEYLYKLTQKLKIEDIVEFHQAIPVSKMEDEMETGILFSPSVHSDENFGLVVFRALNLGIPVVISLWGGHLDFQSSFSPIQYFKVYQTAQGAKCNPFEMASTILEAWSNLEAPKATSRPDYSIPEVLPGKSLMEPTSMKKEIENRIEDSFPWRVRKWPLYGKLFSDYGDQKYQLSLELYGAQKRLAQPEKNAVISPEVENLDSEFKLLDCRAGVLSYPRKEEKRNIKVKKLDRSEVYLSSSELSWLWDHGYIYYGEL